MTKLDKVNKLIEDLYLYRTTEKGSKIFEEFSNKGYIKELKSLARTLAEDYTEGNADWGNPETIKDIENELRTLSNNFQDEQLVVKTTEVESKMNAEKVLKKHYKTVSVEEGKTEDNQSNTWVITATDLITNPFDKTKINKELDKLKTAASDIEDEIARAEEEANNKMIEGLDFADKTNRDSIINLAMNYTNFKDTSNEEALRLAIGDLGLDITEDEFVDLLARLENALRLEHEEF